MHGRYLAGAVGLNILSAVFNIFSFAVLIPLLNILFKVDSAVYEFMPWGTEGASFKDVLINNFYFYVSDFAGKYGTLNTLSQGPAKRSIVSFALSVKLLGELPKFI